MLWEINYSLHNSTLYKGHRSGHFHNHEHSKPFHRCFAYWKEEVQPATGTVDTVLLCHHWIRPLHVNNCRVQLSYQICPQKTTEGSPDCWANHWYNPPHSPGTVLIQSEQKGWKNHSDPSHPAHFLFKLLPSVRRYRALSTRTTRHRNSFFPQAIHFMNTWQ